MYNNILHQLGYKNINEFINSDEFKTYVIKKLSNRILAEKPLIADIITNTLRLDGKFDIMCGQSNLSNDIEDYLTDEIRKRKILKIINRINNVI